MGQRLGQHFLANTNTAKKIIESAGLKQSDIVLEIGPGRGILTEMILPRVKEVVAVEIDFKLANFLKRFSVKYDNLTVLNENFLKLDSSKYSNIKFVANLPYYITSPILQKIVAWPSWNSAYVMIQKEVAERLVAQPSSSRYGILTISIGLYAEVKKIFDVPQVDFKPPPKVMSSVIELTPSSRYDMSGIDNTGFFNFLHSCFQQKRKTLVNSLAHNLPLEKNAIAEMLNKSGYNQMARAEDISISGYLDLYKSWVELADLD